MSYIYETSIIRFREKQLLTKQQLLDLTKMSYDDCAEFISSALGKNQDIPSLDESLQALVNIEKDSNNLKASVKCVYLKTEPREVFEKGSIEPSLIYTSIKENNFFNLPPYLSEPAKVALDILTERESLLSADEAVDEFIVKHIISLREKNTDPGFRLYADYILYKINNNVSKRRDKEPKSFSFNPYTGNVNSSLPLVYYMIRRERESVLIRMILTCLYNNMNTDTVRERIDSEYE